MQPNIGTLQETSLHASLKEWYAHPGDALEVPVDGYVIDILRGNQLIEIQTGNFSAIKSKLRQLCEDHSLRLIYPLVEDKWIVRQSKGRKPEGRRKSPKRARLAEIFRELVYLGEIPSHPNFSFEVLKVQVEELRRDDGMGSWRRNGWSIVDRQLLEVTGCTVFTKAQDYLQFIPNELHQPFTNRELAAAATVPSWLAAKMTYSLRAMGMLENAGKRGHAHLFARNGGNGAARAG